MTNQLESAIKQLSKLPEKEQNHMAKWIMAEINSEEKWNKLFSESENQLNALAEEALSDFKNGQTKELNINKL